MTARLREVLAQRVEERRARDAADESLVSPDGVFTFLASEPLLHFSTTGRITGNAHPKFWGPYAVRGDTIYLIEEIGHDAQWVRNALANPSVELWGQDGGHLPARARIVTDAAELDLAHRLLERRLSGFGIDRGLLETGLILAFDAD